MPLCSQLQLPGVAGLGVFDAGYHVDRHSEVDQGAPRGDNYKSLTFTPTQTTICPRHVRYPLFNANRPIFFAFSIDRSITASHLALQISLPSSFASSFPSFFHNFSPPIKTDERKKRRRRERNRDALALSSFFLSTLPTRLPTYLPT